MAKPQRTIHDHIRERTELARTYAEDGAFYTAADIFAEVSDLLRQRARDCDPRFAKQAA